MNIDQYLEEEFAQLTRILETVHTFETGSINKIYTEEVVAGMCSQGVKLIRDLLGEVEDDDVINYLEESMKILKGFSRSIRSPYDDLQMIGRIFKSHCSRIMGITDSDEIYLTSVEPLSDKIENRSF